VQKGAFFKGFVIIRSQFTLWKEHIHPHKDTAFVLFPLNPVLSQSKRGYTGFAGIKRFYYTFGCSIQALNSQPDLTVSRKPEFKKTVSQGDNSFIDQDISILVNSFYIKRFLGQFRLTGGHVMNCSPVRPFYIWRHSDQHFIFWKRNPFLFFFREFKHYLPRGNETFDLLFGPIPIVGDCHSLNGINVIQ
jgi:hypothetical protein